MLAEGFENKVMHTSFRVGETTLMAWDGCGPEDGNFDGFSLSLSCQAKPMPTEFSPRLALKFAPVPRD